MNAEYIQLELFNDVDDISICKGKIELLQSKHDNLRKGIFRRYNELSKAFNSLSINVELLQLEIARMKNDRLHSE